MAFAGYKKEYMRGWQNGYDKSQQELKQAKQQTALAIFTELEELRFSHKDEIANKIDCWDDLWFEIWDLKMKYLSEAEIAKLEDKK